MIFSTGYMANLGSDQRLVGPGDTVFCDRLNHASIYDGIKLSGATLARFPHRDLDRLENLMNKAGPGRRPRSPTRCFRWTGTWPPCRAWWI